MQLAALIIFLTALTAVSIPVYVPIVPQSFSGFVWAFFFYLSFVLFTKGCNKQNIHTPHRAYRKAKITIEDLLATTEHVAGRDLSKRY